MLKTNPCLEEHMLFFEDLHLSPSFEIAKVCLLNDLTSLVDLEAVQNYWRKRSTLIFGHHRLQIPHIYANPLTSMYQSIHFVQSSVSFPRNYSSKLLTRLAAFTSLVTVDQYTVHLPSSADDTFCPLYLPIFKESQTKLRVASGKFQKRKNNFQRYIH